MSIPADQNISSLFTAARHPEMPILASLMVRAAARLAQWSQRQRTRRHLRGLPPELLKDVGLTRELAERESLKRFWMP